MLSIKTSLETIGKSTLLNGLNGYSIGYAPFFHPPRLPIEFYGSSAPPYLAVIDSRVETCTWLAIFVVAVVSLVTLAGRNDEMEAAIPATKLVEE